MESPPHSTTLALDLGNSGGKAAVFRSGSVREPAIRFSGSEWPLVDGLVTNHGVENIVYSSVANVPPQEYMDKWTRGGIPVTAVAARRPLPFPSEYGTPDTLGQDRVAVIAAALAMAGRKLASPPSPAPARSGPYHAPGTQIKAAGRGLNLPVLIVDAGSCMTADLVDVSGRHAGGNISPGLRMRLRAMHEFTARLPLPAVAEPRALLGQSTEEALRHGAMLGMIYELEGLYHRLAGEHGGLTLLLTGGDGAWLKRRLSVPCSHYPDLVLRGLYELTSLYV